MSETIAAIATGQAVGGIGVIRISGDRALEIADKVFTSVSGRPLSEMKGYHAAYGRVHDFADWSDEAVALVFRSPHSYTGEDVAELSCHGGLVTVRLALAACLSAGARLAQPGEFTKRAYLNGRISLDQAESVMAVITAGSRLAALAAERAKSTTLSVKIASLCDSLKELAARIAVSEEFPDEIDYELDIEDVKRQLGQSVKQLSSFQKNGRLGRMQREGIQTAIIGKPNVGKSTLMNLLSGCEKSIVTSIPGTTRDVVEETVMLGDCPLRLCDTAGLHDTDDPVETIGVDKAKYLLETASLIIAVFDSSSDLTAEDITILKSIQNTPAVAVINKSDKGSVLDIQRVAELIPNIVKMSAVNGDGIEQLTETVMRITELNGLDPAENILVNTRQLDCVDRALKYTLLAMENIEYAEDMALLYIRDAVNALLELTGENADSKIIEEIFNSFCVGK